MLYYFELYKHHNYYFLQSPHLFPLKSHLDFFKLKKIYNIKILNENCTTIN